MGPSPGEKNPNPFLWGVEKRPLILPGANYLGASLSPVTIGQPPVFGHWGRSKGAAIFSFPLGDYTGFSTLGVTILLTGV